MAIRGDRGIYFGSGIETRDFKKDADEIRKEILSIQKEGEKMDLSPLNEMMDIQKKAIADLEKQYKSLGQQIENIQPGLAQQELVREYRKVGAAIEAEKQAMEAMKEAYKSFGDEQVKVRTRQREIRHELYALSAAGKDNTEEFRALVKELQGLDSAVDSVKSLQNTLRRGGVEMKAFVGTVRAGTGVFATMTGFMGLFAEQNERFAQIQTRLQSVLSISMGIEQTYNALLKEGQLIQSVRALQARAAVKAKNLETKSTIAATAAQRAYNAVAKANPYVLIAGLILSVVGALTLLTRRNREAANSMKEFNQKVADSMASSIVQVRLFSEQWKRMGDDVSRQDWIDRNKGAFNSLGIEINNVKDAETAFVTNTSTVVRAMELRAKATATQELAQEAYKKYLENTDKQIEINKKLVDRSIIQGLKTGWGRIFGADEPIDEANKSLERYNKLIVDAADLTLEADRLIASVDLAPKSSAKDKSKDKKEEKEREKTFKEMLDARKKIWEDYYEAVRVIGRKAADEIYKDDISAHESYLRELESRRDQMLEEGITTKKQVDQLNILNQTIQDLLKLDSPFEKQRKEIESSLSEIDTFTDKLKFLESQAKNLGTSFEDIEMAAYLKDQTDKIVDERQRMFDELMKAHRDYETKIKEIDARTSDLLSIATTPEQIKIIEDQAARQKYDAYIEMLKEKYEDLNMVFTDIAALSREKLIEFREIFEHELDKADEAAKKTEIGKIIRKINRELEKLDATPIKNIVNGLKEIRDSTDDVSRSSGFAKFGSGLRSTATSFRSIVRDVSKASEDLGIEMDSVFGTILGNLAKTVEGMEQIGEGADKISESLKASDPIGRISGITSIVTGAIGIFGSWLSSTQMQGRELKKVVREVERLQKAYRDLEKAIEGTVSTGRYDIQAKMLESLRSQQEALRKAIDKETSKWRPIRWDKVMEWDAEIGEIEEQIEELVQSIQDDLLTINAAGVASSLGDALVEAFERGEDASESLNNAINNIFKTMIRNSVVSSLMSRIQPVLDDMLRSMGIDPKTGELLGSEVKQLTKADRSEYRERLKEIAKAGESILEGASDLFRGIIDLQDEELADPLRGAIKGMTQETADILAGQFNAIRMDTSGILTTLRNNQEKVDAKVIHLANIDANTARMYKEVKELNEKIKEGDVRSSGL